MYQSQEMIMLRLKSVIVNLSFSEDLLKDQELMNATNARKLVQLLNGHALAHKIQIKDQCQEHHILWFILKVSVMYMVVKMMIIINLMMFGVLTLQLELGPNYNQEHHLTNLSEDQDIALVSIMAECIFLEVFMNWQKKLMK